ncbi:carbohydrate ABC transporter permease [Trueperella pyogenes]|uniref:carbohydrate ABC transporter permease n=3 Tax=Trueperella pyogenes TaxID=1661 RepID=UPI0032474465
MKKRFSARRHGKASAIHLVALIVTALYLIPMLYIVMVALTPTGESTIELPSRFAWENFGEALKSSDFILFFLNSSIVTAISTACQVCLSCMAGYALAKMPIPGKKTVMLILIALLVIPAEIIIVPLFVMLTHFPLMGGNDIWGAGGSGLLDTYTAMIIPHLASALGIFLMRQFYIDLPDEIGESARVDGAGEFRIFSRIYTPLAIPAVSVVTVIAFQAAWNDFLWPLVTTRSNDMRTLQLGLAVFYQENSTQWNLLMATVLMMSVPVILIFLYVQRFFADGISAGSVKQ